jgi:hypothetical protein
MKNNESYKDDELVSARLEVTVPRNSEAFRYLRDQGFISRPHGEGRVCFIVDRQSHEQFLQESL